ncbi:hypothetical protein A7985_23350 [Pseudoalteromonas luteoviolacea]|uniref:Carrier domain-containing protein n=1 Tax=Pseudoalteromonas luteoviolacea TaxID=43657 RepID=A0A1C0TJU8_9GAMM|nr:non-ribosomal peptide synthetase [Pseudoalteromonas luteoviolacea]OCQ18708.1 hypothetical protein A7985_23350 [Pseudoalteromonas luteoviolacea]
MKFETLPLSLIQQDIYFDQMNFGQSPLYNVGGYIHLPSIDIDRITCAHKKLVMNHDVFGLRITFDGSDVTQHISHERNLDLPIVDLSHHDDPQRAASQWLNTHFQTVIPIDDNELYKATLLKLSDDLWFYVGLAHHIMMDGWGFANWAERLGSYYMSGEEPVTKPWSAVIENEQNYLNSARYRKDKDYWASELASCPKPFLTPYYNTNSESKSVFKSERLIADIPEQRHQAISERAKELDIPIAQLYQVILANYFATVYKLDEIVIGTPVHNRRDKLDKSMLGTFISVVPLRIQFDNEQSQQALCEQVSKRIRSNFRHQRFPLGEMMRTLATDMFQIKYSYLSVDSHLDFDGKPAHLVYQSHDHEQTPLMFTLWEYSDSHTQLQVDHNLAYFNKADMTVLVEEFFKFVDTFLAISIDDFSRVRQNETEPNLYNTGRMHLLNYWQGYLKDIPQSHNLPLDRSRPSIQNYQAGVHQGQLGADLSKALSDYCTALEISVPLLIHSVLSILTARMSASDHALIDLDITAPAHAKHGLLHTHLSDGLLFEQLLAVHKQTLYDTQLTPLPETHLLQLLAIPHTPSHKNIYQLGVTDSEPPPLTHADNQLDIRLHIIHDQTSTKLHWRYDTSLFDESTIAYLQALLLQLTEAVLDNPEKEVTSYTLLSASTTDTMLSAWNDTKVDWPSHSHCLHTLFEQQATLTPNALAIQCEQGTLSYQALSERSDALAHYLVSQGVVPEQPVGICLSRTADMMVAVLAVLKAGGAYVPLDPSFPEARLNYMVTHSGANIILTERTYQHTLFSPHNEYVVCLDDAAIQSQINSMDREGGLPEVDNKQLAYIMYTSGSTGKPKGVMVEHASVQNIINSMASELSVTAQDKQLAVTTLSFDISVLELFLPLLNGASVYIASQQEAKDPQCLLDILSRQEITMMQATPATWQMMLVAGWQQQTPLKMLCGGEALPDALAQELLAQSPTLWNVYGPTETTIWSTFKQVEQHFSKPNLIGKPIANTQVYVLDSHMQPVPVGVPGELYISGQGLARGYWSQAELTAQRFVNNPFKGNALMYRTGDLVRWLPDGQLQFIARIDSQIKLRGYRLELGEVESCLNDLEDIFEGVVACINNSQPDAYLAAYFTTKDNQQASVESLKTQLASQLPSYMVPEVFVELDAMPLTANGKIDRKALPTPDLQHFAQQVYVAPRNELETQLCDIWQTVLNVERVSVTDSFFALGGHSLTATKAISAIRQVLGLNVSVKSIFEHPSVEAFAIALADQRDELTRPALEVAGRDNPLPLSFSQQRLWFVDQIHSGSAQYNMPGAFLLEGALDTQHFEHAIIQIIQRHEVLRTCFVKSEGKARQVITQQFSAPITYTDFTEESNQELAVKTLLQAEADREFDLSSDLMLRVHLVKLDPARHVALFVLHHIAADGWSVDLLSQEFSRFYNASCNAAEPDLPALSVQYADYAIWQQSWLQGDYLESQLEYWQSQLAGIPEVHSLPLDFERSSQEQLHCGVSTHRISDTLYTKMKQFCDTHNATLFMLLETVLAILIHRYSREDDVVIGTAIAGRDQAELEPLIGFFVNDLIIRTQFNEQDSFLDLLGCNKNAILDAYAHQHVPFEMLVERLAPNRDLRYNPLVQIKLDLHTHTVQNLALNDIQSQILPIIEPYSRYDLYISATQSEAQLSFDWLFSKEIFKAESVQRMANNFEALLDALISSPSHQVNSVSALTQHEQVKLIKEWNNHRVNYDIPDTVHHVFEQQVQRTPEAIAISSPDGNMSYAQLNEEANQVAHFLNAQKVGNGAPVALCVERSMEMLIGLLGILKAGCCYVPLEPRNPDERILHMLEDSGAQVVLTDSELMAELPFDDILAIPLDEQMRDLLMGAQPTSNPTKDEASTLAYIMYTSGSTGLPKGVMVPHAGVVNYLQYAATNYFDAETSAGIVSGPLVFDATLTTLLSPLFAGKTIELLPDDENVISHLAKQISRTDTQLLFKITPAHLDALVAHGILSTGHDIAHTVVVGGEQLTSKTLAPWLQHFPEVGFINEYGPTETVVGCSVYRVKGQLSDTIKGGAIPIGKPIANTQLYVLNDALQVQATGAIGELYIAGHGVAHGYHNKEALTSTSFIKAPAHLQASSEYIYRSGDLVKWLDDGQLSYIGRIDEQVKLRGFRIELTEIEHKLGSLEGVGECIVLCLDENGEKRLVAYLTLSDPIDVEDDDAFVEFKRAQVKTLRTHLKAQLPAYMIPSVFVFLERFPLTTNGKLDKKALPAPSESDLQKTDYIAPRNEVEKVLCEIWEQVLGLEEVGIEDNFFALGGDSIIAIQISSRAGQHGLAMSVRQMFEYQTIAELSQHIEQDAHTSHAEQDELQGTMALMPIQQQFFDWQFAAPHHFNQSVLLSAPAHFDGLALKALFIALLTRHDALRLRFTSVQPTRHQANFVQLNEHMLEQSSIVHDLSGLDHHAYFEQLHTLCKQHQTQLNYTDGPIIKAVLFTSDDKAIGNRIFFVCHHLVIDGVSWRILHQDLAQFWQQWERDTHHATNIVLDAKTSSYRQFVEALTAYAHTEQIQSQRPYWLQQACAAVPALPDHHSGVSSNTQITLSAEDTTALLGECNRPYRTQVNEIMLAALSLAWQKWAGASRMRILLEGHGREEVDAHTDVSSTIGWFTTLFPLVHEIPEGGDIAAAIMQSKASCRAVPNKGIGFGALRYLVDDSEFSDAVANVEQDAIVFNYLGQVDNGSQSNSVFPIAPEFDKLAAQDNIAAANHQTAPLTLNGMVSQGALQFTLIGSAQFSREQVDTLAQLFKEALVSCVRHCQHAHAQLTVDDFPNSTLNNTELTQLNKAYPTLDKLYITTPTQSGMLFHGLLDGNGSTYTGQTFCDLVGDVHIEAFKDAWQQVVERHDILRTCFTALDGVQMHQVVTKQTQIPFIELDWSHKGADVLDQALADYRAQDKAQSFDFETPPLTRITLIKLSQERYHFVWSHHHTLLDGWCLPIVFTEVLASYEALIKGKAIQLTQPMPYERYIDWLNQQHQAEAKQFWQAMLEDVQHATPINIDTLTGENTASGAQKHQLVFDEATTSQLQELAKQNHCTMSVVLQAAWACLLRRYSDQDDVVFGLTVSGRPAQLKGVEDIVGLFINTLPTRVQFNEDMSLSALLKILQRNNMDLDEYGYLGLAQIQQLSGVDNGQPLFDSVLVYENYPNEIAVDDLQKQLGFAIEHLDDSAQTNYGLTLVARQQSALRIDIGYYAEQFNPVLIERLAEHFQHILKAFIHLSLSDACEAPAIQQLDMLAMPEQQTLIALGSGNRNDAKLPSLVDMFTQQATLTPHHIAVSCADQRMTYQALSQRSTQFAHYLLSHNVKQSDFVAVHLPRGTELMVVLLGILKSGAAYIPIDNQLPEGRIQAILQDSQPVLTITHTAKLAQLNQLKSLHDSTMQVIAVEQVAFEQQAVQEAMPTLNTQEDLAYVLYTSGSTGKPKGVMVSHHNLSNYLQYSARQYMADHLDGAIVSGSIGFDATLCPLFTPLLTGKTVCMLPEQDSVLETLPAVLLGDQAYMIKVTPSHLHALENILKDKLPAQPVSTEHVFVIGGETLTAQRLAPWQSHILPAAKYYNQYGPTETTVAATVGECSAMAVTPSQSLSIGHAIQNTQLYVCNTDGMLQPVGVPGELYIAGQGVAQGYLSDEDKTNQHFIANPYSSDVPMMYRTGDTVRWLPNGQLEFLGRKDDQLQLRGYRIELTDIERAIASLDMVKQQAVRCHGEGEHRVLIGYVVPASEAFSLEALQVELRTLLPDYMLPSRYVVLDEMPLNQSGKIDRQALALITMQASTIEHHQPPQTDTEKALSDLWLSALGMEQTPISRTDNFFNLGGHSLMATRLISLIRQHLDVEVPLKILFEHPVLAEQAIEIDNQLRMNRLVELEKNISDDSEIMMEGEI